MIIEKVIEIEQSYLSNQEGEGGSDAVQTTPQKKFLHRKNNFSYKFFPKLFLNSNVFLGASLHLSGSIIQFSCTNNKVSIEYEQMINNIIFIKYM